MFFLFKFSESLAHNTEKLCYPPLLWMYLDTWTPIYILIKRFFELYLFEIKLDFCLDHLAFFLL